MLTLVLCYKWYDAISSGEKLVEYRRAISPKWQRDIWGKRDKIISEGVRFQRGYSKTSMVFRIAEIDIGECPYDGWDGLYYRLHLIDNLKPLNES